MKNNELEKKSSLLHRIILRSARFPIIYFILGALLLLVSYADNIFPTLIQWKNWFDAADKIGNILITLAFFTFTYKVFVFMCLRYEQNPGHKILNLIVASIRKSAYIVFILIALNTAINIITPTQTHLAFANHLVNTALILSLGWIAIHVVYTIEAVIYEYVTKNGTENDVRAKIMYTKMRIIRNLVTALVVIVTSAAILMSFNSVRNIGISLLASAGFLTAIIGLSAQKTLFSLFSGIQIAIAQPIKIGDVVVIEKETGIVEEITFTYVILKLGDGRRLSVPITYFVERPFENWSHEVNLRGGFFLYVDFSMPIAPLRQELENILNASAFWDRKSMNLHVANFNERCVELRIQVSAKDADDLSNLRAEVREKLLKFIQENYPNHLPKTRYENGLT